jgi:hypothetical protein
VQWQTGTDRVEEFTRAAPGNQDDQPLRPRRHGGGDRLAPVPLLLERSNIPGLGLATFTFELEPDDAGTLSGFG